MTRVDRPASSAQVGYLRPVSAGRVRVLLFATLRQQAGAAEVEIELPPGSSVEGCWAALCARHPGLAAHRSTIRPALNRAYSDWSAAVSPGDELAFLPPVSGGRADTLGKVRVGPQPIDIGAMQARPSLRGVGGIATFVGVVRDPDEGVEVTHLTYEAYQDMAERELSAIASEALSRPGVAEVVVHHRTGRVERGEASVAVVVTAAHRHQALEGCTYVIDQLKVRAPIWKVAG